jgi:hypothetical protein
MKRLPTLLLAATAATFASAQDADMNQLFLDQSKLDISMSVVLKDIKKNTNDSTFLPVALLVKNASGGVDSVKAEVRARGNFRRQVCYFPPMRLKIDKKDAKGTAFEGNKSLKLVVPCQTSESKNTLIMKEYMAYKINEIVTPYNFPTRLVNLSLTEPGKKPKTWDLAAFLIEDDDPVAKRHHAKVMENLNLHPLAMDDTSSLRHDLFQYMIANTDWSTTFLHNAKVIFQAPKKYIPLAYDFDMAGLVDAPYATVNETLGIANVRERLYRGFCRNAATTQAVRQEFIANEGAIMKVVDAQAPNFSNPKDFATAKNFISDFFKIVKSDAQFKSNIVDQCRTK